jgi:hypothetical protein
MVWIRIRGKTVKEKREFKKKESGLVFGIAVLSHCVNLQQLINSLCRFEQKY